MTKHPLTDEIISKQFGILDVFNNEMDYDEDDMRAAYDLGRAEQLEQVIAHIKLCHWHTNDFVSLARLVAEWFVGPKQRIAELREAMRPTTQEES